MQRFRILARKDIRKKRYLSIPHIMIIHILKHVYNSKLLVIKKNKISIFLFIICLKNLKIIIIILIYLDYIQIYIYIYQNP